VIGHGKQRGFDLDARPSAERAKPLRRSAEVGDRPSDPLRSRVSHLRWRERIAALVGNVVPMAARAAWARAANHDPKWLDRCASPASADKHTLRLVDLLFLKAHERAEIMNAIEEWAQALERGDL
jgi:hypothetical protein